MQNTLHTLYTLHIQHTLYTLFNNILRHAKATGNISLLHNWFWRLTSMSHLLVIVQIQSPSCFCKTFHALCRRHSWHSLFKSNNRVSRHAISTTVFNCLFSRSLPFNCISPDPKQTCECTHECTYGYTHSTLTQSIVSPQFDGIFIAGNFFAFANCNFQKRSIDRSIVQSANNESRRRPTSVRVF